MTGARGAALVALLAAGCAAPARKPAVKIRSAAPVAASTAPAAAQPAAALPVEEGRPLVLSPLVNLNDFSLVANGGFDPGWRVAFDAAWVVQLPPAPQGGWKKAYLGAKIGRAKMEPVPGRPSWEKRRIRGEIDIAVAGEPLWPHSRRYLLARAEEIPLEGDPDNAADGVGEARWFWTEIPLKHVSFDRPNFVTLYSPSESLKGADRAPVLAAGPKSALIKGVNTWLSAGLRGQPPLGAEEAFKAPIHNYAPAVALKLVPAHDRSVKVQVTAGPESGEIVAAPFLLSASVKGEDVSRVWVESSTDTKKWTSAAPALATPPYAFTVRTAPLPAGEVWLRVSAVDDWGARGDAEPVKVIVADRKR